MRIICNSFDTQELLNTYTSMNRNQTPNIFAHRNSLNRVTFRSKTTVVKREEEEDDDDKPDDVGGGDPAT